MRRHPPTLLAAAVVLVIEAAGVLVAAVLAAMDTAAGRSYQLSSGIALTVLAFFAVAMLAVIAMGLYKAKRWSRTPAFLAQFFIGVAAILLLNGNRLALGMPALLLAVAGLVGIFVRPSTEALVGTGRAAVRSGEAVESSEAVEPDEPEASQATSGKVKRPGKAQADQAAPPRRPRRPNRHTSPSRRTA